MNEAENFLLKVEKTSSHLARGTIEVKPDIVRAIRDQIVTLYKSRVDQSETGFKEVPLDYIKENYRKEINSSLKSFILRYYIIDYLTNQVINKNMVAANHPRLNKIELTDDDRAIYTFDMSMTTPISIREWKNFSFKAPKRKNYKDLDKQVTHFIKQEHEHSKQVQQDVIEQTDWVCFDAILVNQNGQPVLEKYKNSLWVRMNIGVLSDPFIELFLNKRTGDSFLTDQLSLYENFEDETSGKHYFFVTVTSLIKGSHCSMEALKSMFKLKNKSEVHEKLIEVFSYRNDISQRKAIVEEMFNLLFTKHRFEVPKHLIIRRQEEILNSLKKRPDYQVYKLNKNFTEQVSALAEKQLKEKILIEQIANHENIKVENKDIENYLNLFSNQRLKEFVYFKPSQDLFEEATVPMHSSQLKQLCRREKTLNYILYHLTR